MKKENLMFNWKIEINNDDLLILQDKKGNVSIIFDNVNINEQQILIELLENSINIKSFPNFVSKINVDIENKLISITFSSFVDNF